MLLFMFFKVLALFNCAKVLAFFLSWLCSFSSELESSSGSEKEEAGPGNLLEEPRPRTTRPWTPLSLFNSDYVALLKEREQTLIRHDFIKENIVSQIHFIVMKIVRLLGEKQNDNEYSSFCFHEVVVLLHEV